MSDETNTATITPPPDAGLDPGRPGQDGPVRRRSGDDLIEAAAKGEKLTGDEQIDLLDYFCANGELPEDDKTYPLEFEIGKGADKRSNVWRVRRLLWDEWTDAEDRGRDKETGEFNGFVTASYVVARVLVQPQLGPRVHKLQQQAQKAPDGKVDGRDANGNRVRVDPPADGAELLRRMFASQGGVLLSMSWDVRQISRLGGEQVSSRVLDQEVAAGEA